MLRTIVGKDADRLESRAVPLNAYDRDNRKDRSCVAGMTRALGRSCISWSHYRTSQRNESELQW